MVLNFICNWHQINKHNTDYRFTVAPLAVPLFFCTFYPWYKMIVETSDFYWTTIKYMLHQISKRNTWYSMSTHPNTFVYWMNFEVFCSLFFFFFFFCVFNRWFALGIWLTGFPFYSSHKNRLSGRRKREKEEINFLIRLK